MADKQHLPPYDGEGTALSLYLSLDLAGTSFRDELPLRWRAAREALVGQGAGETDLALLEARVQQSEACPRTLAAFVRDGRLHAEEMEGFEGTDLAAAGPVPIGLPWLRWHQQWVPYVVVCTDRAGADLAASPGPGTAAIEESLEGPDDVIERNAPGGWSQARYQRRAEDSWAHNAAEVADHVVRLVARVGADVVLVAGDVRAVQELTDHLPQHVRNLTEHVTSGLEQGEGRVRLAPATVAQQVHDAAARLRTRQLEELQEAVGGGLQADGVDPCAEALRRGAVARLFVVDRPGDDRQAQVWADEPTRVGPPEADGLHAPLREALVRATLAQGGEVTVVGPEEASFADGFAALLRY